MINVAAIVFLAVGILFGLRGHKFLKSKEYNQALYNLTQCFLWICCAIFGFVGYRNYIGIFALIGVAFIAELFMERWLSRKS